MFLIRVCVECGRLFGTLGTKPKRSCQMCRKGKKIVSRRKCPHCEKWVDPVIITVKGSRFKVRCSCCDKSFDIRVYG